jgi:hypothetical protein
VLVFLFEPKLMLSVAPGALSAKMTGDAKGMEMLVDLLE